jgi:hypothetical protein
MRAEGLNDVIVGAQARISTCASAITTAGAYTASTVLDPRIMLRPCPVWQATLLQVIIIIINTWSLSNRSALYGSNLPSSNALCSRSISIFTHR